MNDPTDKVPLRLRLAALTSFLPLFESDDFTFGSWDSSEGHLPYFFQSEGARNFVQTAYAFGWCNSNVNWVDWIKTDEAQRFADGPAPIERATVSELEKLLTAFIRQDRFVEGNLDGLYRSGHLTAIVRRAEALLKEIEADE